MSNAQDPDNEKLFRELDEQTKPLKDYLATHTSKEGSSDDPPTGCISPVLIGVVHFVVVVVLGMSSIGGSIGRATSGSGPSESTLFAMDGLISVLCPTLPLAGLLGARDLSVGGVLLLVLISSVAYSAALSWFITRSKRQKPNDRNG